MDRGKSLLPVDVCDTGELVCVLSQVFLFVEHANAMASRPVGRAVVRNDESLGPSKGIAGVLLSLRNKMSRPGSTWPGGSDLLRLASRVGVCPTPNSEILDALVRLLLRPAKVGSRSGDQSWSMDPTENPLYLPRASESAERLSERVVFYERAGRPFFANRPLIDVVPVLRKNLSVFYWEEPFDSISVVRLFLSEVLAEQGRAADQHLQRWLCDEFRLGYDKPMKYALAKICQRFNVMFYESAVPSTQTIHVKRAATLATSLLIEEISGLLPHAEFGADAALRQRQAFGIYLFLRFCRQLRCGYCWFDRQHLESSSAESGGGSPHTSGGHFSSALRSLGYTYLQSRMFGAISGIPGLSNIFRGGLLPRTDSGRTLALSGPPGVGKTVLALQMMADVAGMGGLAIYFSLEESFGSIVDRLITFDLYRPDKFKIVQAGSDFDNVLREASEEHPRKGILVLYGREKPFSLLQAIDSISSAAEGKRLWRALVLDSINALSFSSEAGGRQRPGHREELSALVGSIEKNKFLGILLAEKDDRGLWTLPYLMDTVIELGIDDATHMRWIEIKKCRIQDYHPGKHPFRMADSLGVTIYPSLGARRSSLRGRVRSTASEQRFIPFPQSWKEASGLDGIREKSSTLIWGPPGGGKTLLLLNLLTEHTLKRSLEARRSEAERTSDLGPPANVLVVTFRTPEKTYFQNLQRHPALCARWNRLKKVKMRWFSVGVNLSPEQMVSEIWRYFNSSRREGLPVDRVVFDETESAEDFLPALRNEPLFWPTLFEITSTEAVNSFFVCSSTIAEPPLMRLLKPSMDYVLHAYEKSDNSSERPTGDNSAGGTPERSVAIEKHPDLVPGDHKMVVPLRAYSEGDNEGLIY